MTRVVGFVCRGCLLMPVAPRAWAGTEEAA